MKKQASGLSCFVCGVQNPYGLHLKFYEEGPGEIRAEIRVPEHFQGFPGIVHGGIIAAMLDEVAGRAWMGENPPRFMVTAKLSIRYRKPVPVETLLVLRGHAGEDRGKVATATGEIFAPDGSLLAEAEVVLVNIPEELLSSQQDLVDSWQVYPDEE